MASSYGNMTLRERVTEVDRKQRRRNRNEERSEDGFESPDQESKKPKKKDGRGSKYDSQGIHKASKQDLCDCMIVDCPGCFMPCKKCSSTKCGHECRRNRRWVYENIQIEGTSINIQNQFKK
ncbi:hypothetical protein AVEN_237647-1 [Araneus ventricosus]|uniref:ARF7 effector protein C-terminal domain-containing protein n=2 Tax=Araneus ventricosus TaxID=182803 RepID=A0A4Y2LF54_ARAVE|nr:hypothetical protein AVEN_237647-1 [Araneus ventricosus]